MYKIHPYVIRMKGGVRRGHIARNSMRSSSSSNQSQEEEEELRRPVAVTSLPAQPAYRPFQPVAQLVVALHSQLPPPAHPEHHAHPAHPEHHVHPTHSAHPEHPAHHPTQNPSQARLPRVTFADLPPSYSMADLQYLPKYSEITSV